MSHSKDYYELLGVSRSEADDADAVKRAFRQVAKTHHPDKGGDPELYRRISKAASVLQDSKLRKIYDRHGESGLEEHEKNPHHHQGSEAVHQFNTGHPFFVNQRRESTFRVVEVEVTLEEIYSGVSDRKVEFEWEKGCLECHKTGCKKGKRAHTCPMCQGQGVVVKIRHLGPGMIQQSTTICPTCQGNQVVIASSDKCELCKGKGYNLTKDSVLLRIPKGAGVGRLFPASESVTQQLQDDVQFVLKQKSHPLFERFHHHLLCRRNDITLLQALTGIEITLTGLDGQPLRISLPTPTEPGSFFRLKHAGLPQCDNKGTGDLLVVVDRVVFPSKTEMSPTVVHILKRCLPKPNIDPKTDQKTEQLTTPLLAAENISGAVAQELLVKAQREQPQTHPPPSNSNCRTQ